MNTSRPRPRLFIENHPTRLITEVLLRPYNFDFDIEERMTLSGSLSSARSSLERQPEHPVVLLFNMRTENPITTKEWRASADRQLGASASTPDSWLVVPVVPRLDAWALTDPRIKKDFDKNVDSEALYADRAARIVELTRKQPFDPTELLRTNSDFQKLVEFLRKHAPEPAATTR